MIKPMTLLERVNRHVDGMFKSDKEVKKALIEIYNRTKSLRITGKEFGVTERTIGNWLRMIGVKRRPKGGANNTVGSVVERINEADPKIFKYLTAWQIGKKYHVSARYVHWLKCKGKISITYRNANRGELQEEINECNLTEKHRAGFR